MVRQELERLSPFSFFWVFSLGPNKREITFEPEGPVLFPFEMAFYDGMCKTGDWLSVHLSD